MEPHWQPPCETLSLIRFLQSISPHLTQAPNAAHEPPSKRVKLACRGRYRCACYATSLSTSPTKMVPLDRASARSPALCKNFATTDAVDRPVDPRFALRVAHGSHSWTPRNRTVPTVNFFPTRRDKRTPRVTTFRRVLKRPIELLFSRLKRSISSASMNVMSWPGCLSARPK